MKYEIKKGDKLVVVVPDNHGRLKKGDILIASEDCFSESDYAEIRTDINSWYVFRFIKYKEEDSKTTKPKLDLHVVLKDSCNNFLKICDSYEEAEIFTKTLQDEASIYRLNKISSVKSERIIIPFKEEKAKKK
jgi:hypothetical protein